MTTAIAMGFVMTAIISFFSGAMYGAYLLSKKINERLSK